VAMFESLFQATLTTGALVASRSTGLVSGAPFPGRDTPREVRVGLVVGLTVLMTPLAAARPAPIDDVMTPDGFVACMCEVLFGLALGLTARMFAGVAELVGGAMSQAIGLTSASLLNPQTETHDTSIGRVFTYAGTLLFLGLGLHRVLLGALCQSFEVMPVGTVFPTRETARQLSELSTHLLGVALRLSAPILAWSALVQLGLALLARSAPQLQLLSVGLTAVVLFGLSVFGDASPPLVRALSDALVGVPSSLERVTSTFRTE